MSLSVEGFTIFVSVSFVVVLGELVLWAFSPIVVMSGDPTGIGLLLVRVLVSFVVAGIVISLSGVAVVLALLLLVVVLVAFLVGLALVTAHVVHDVLDCSVFLNSTVDDPIALNPCRWEGV